MEQIVRHYYPRLPIRPAGPAKSFVREIPADPRGPLIRGYKMARPCPPKEKPKRKWIFKKKRIEPDRDLDDSKFDRLIVVSKGPFNNTGRTLFREINSEKLQNRFKADYLFLVEITDIEARDSPRQPRVRIVVHDRLISLSDGLLILDHRNVLDCNAPTAPTGKALFGLPDAETFQKDDFQRLREGLDLLSRRFGAVLAWQLDLCSREKLLLEENAWAADIDQAKKNLRSKIVP